MIKSTWSPLTRLGLFHSRSTLVRQSSIHTPAAKGDLSHKFRTKSTAFNDHTFLEIEAGRGGDGCVSFLREKFLPKGPPNGGSGGHGGDVYIMAIEGETSLAETRRVKSMTGRHGRGSSMNGKKGEDLIIKVPIGTIVREVELPAHARVSKELNSGGTWVHYPGYAEDNLESDRLREAERILLKQQRSLLPATGRRQIAADRILLDLSASTPANSPHLLCRGGLGGFGNTFFQTADNRAPRFASRGLIGEHKYFELELKTLADVGLVGMPNAGKSTFLGAISNARPRVANWAFTTLSPYLGTISYPEGKFTVADIPGIIEGASQNRGLGHGFLRHIERADILAFVVDLSNNPVEDYGILRAELSAHLPALGHRQSIVIANKADVSGTQTALKNLQAAVDEIWLKRKKSPHVIQSKPLVIPLSSRDQMGVEQAIEIIKSLVEARRATRATIATNTIKDDGQPIKLIEA